MKEASGIDKFVWYQNVRTDPLIGTPTSTFMMLVCPAPTTGLRKEVVPSCDEPVSNSHGLPMKDTAEPQLNVPSSKPSFNVGIKDTSSKKIVSETGEPWPSVKSGAHVRKRTSCCPAAIGMATGVQTVGYV